MWQCHSHISAHPHAERVWSISYLLPGLSCRPMWCVLSSRHMWKPETTRHQHTLSHPWKRHMKLFVKSSQHHNLVGFITRLVCSCNTDQLVKEVNFGIKNKRRLNTAISLICLESRLLTLQDWSKIVTPELLIQGVVKNVEQTSTCRANWMTTLTEQTEQDWLNPCSDKNTHYDGKKDLHTQNKWGFPGCKPTPNVEVSVLRELTHYVSNRV